jgi:phospholipid N-methyltransferase
LLNVTGGDQKGRDNLLGNRLAFLRQFLAHPLATGAVSPSSARLAREMVAGFDWNQIDVVVEFGPGTGAFTGDILRSKPEWTRFFAIEQNPEFARRLAERFPQVTTYCDSVANVGRLCAQEGLTANTANVQVIDAIVCGLPWASFGSALQDQLLNATVNCLRPGGRFATFAYLQGLWLPSGIRFGRKLREAFAKVETSRIVWRNLPPAIIYRCTKSAG